MRRLIPRYPRIAPDGGESDPDLRRKDGKDMAKDHHTIRARIDRSFLDHEIVLSTKTFNAKPMPLKQILFYGGGGLLIIWLVTSTFIKSSGFVSILLFVIWALIAVAYLGNMTKTKELNIQTIPALLSYLPKDSRRVLTRRDSDPSAFYSIVGINSIDEDSGRIRFADGQYGQAYLVVGSASYLLFDEDRTRILDRVDSFWRKVETDAQFIFITTREPQRVHRQVASLERRHQALEIADPDLLDLNDEEYDILTDFVGGRFPSIHQYVIAKAPSESSLMRAHGVLSGEADAGVVLKEATMLDGPETIQMMQTVYQANETRAA